MYGMYEKTVNLAIARSLAARLTTQGARVTLTRQTDTFVELEDRAALANQVRADLFVSVHADSSRNRKANGCTVYVSRDAGYESEQAAATIVRAMTRAGFSTQGVRRANYRVLTRTQCPAILVEVGYLSNPLEARLLAQAGVQEQLAKSLAQGVFAFQQTSGRR